MPTFTELLKSTAATLTQSTSDRLSAAVAKIANQLETAQAEADAARIAHESAMVDHAVDSGTVDDKTLARLKAAADAARDRVGSLTGALATARARQSAAQAEDAREEHKDRWNKAVGVSQFRLDAARDLDKSLKQFADDYRRLLALNGELHQALPANPDPEAVLAHVTVIETAVRKELLRLGVPWAFSWPYGTVSLPPMLPQFEGAHELVQRWAPGA